MQLALDESSISITSMLHMKYEVEADSCKEQQGKETYCSLFKFSPIIFVDLG